MHLTKHQMWLAQGRSIWESVDDNNDTRLNNIQIYTL